MKLAWLLWQPVHIDMNNFKTHSAKFLSTANKDWLRLQGFGDHFVEIISNVAPHFALSESWCWSKKWLGEILHLSNFLNVCPFSVDKMRVRNHRHHLLPHTTTPGYHSDHVDLSPWQPDAQTVTPHFHFDWQTQILRSKAGIGNTENYNKYIDEQSKFHNHNKCKILVEL